VRLRVLSRNRIVSRISQQRGQRGGPFSVRA
jgi:hypothetical protein